MAKRILVLGDTHFPYESRAAFEWVYRITDKLKPDTVVQVGDLLDQFAFSRYPKVLKMDPEKELSLGRAGAEAMWARFKGLDCYQLMGNHDDRIFKKALTSAPELASLVGSSLRSLYTFPNVRTVLDGRDELILQTCLGPVAFQHGHRSRLGDHARFNQMATVVGHSHTGGVVFLRNIRRCFFELNAGFLGDVTSPAFGYHAQRRVHTTTLGVGYLDELGPRFCPYGGK
jgi:predicted phosphodiesterase